MRYTHTKEKIKQFEKLFMVHTSNRYVAATYNDHSFKVNGC